MPYIHQLSVIVILTPAPALGGQCHLILATTQSCGLGRKSFILICNNPLFPSLQTSIKLILVTSRSLSDGSRNQVSTFVNEGQPVRDHLRPGDTHADGDLGRERPRQHHGGGPRLDREVRHRPRLRRHRVRGRDRHHGLRTPWRGPARP